MRAAKPERPGCIWAVIVVALLVVPARTGTAVPTRRAASAPGAADGTTAHPIPPTILADPPTVTCATNANIFNTGFNGTTGVLPNNSDDSNWKVAGNYTPLGTVTPTNKNSNLGYYFRNPNTANVVTGVTTHRLGGTVPPDLAVYPFGPAGSPEFTGSTGDVINPGAGLPATATSFIPAKVGNLSNVWPVTPTGASGVSTWISPLFTENAADLGNQGGFFPTGGLTSDRGDWFFMYQFSLDPSVRPNAFQLSMNWLADNNVTAVFVNGVQQTGINLPQPPRTTAQGGDGTLYTSQGFNAVAGSNPLGPARTDMATGWNAGLNTVVVQVKSTANYIGFRGQVVAGVPLCVPASLALVKSATCGIPPAPCTAVRAAGDVIDYRFTVTNAGNQPITGLTVTDTPTSPAGPSATPSCPVTALAPAASTTCTSSYTVSAADVAAGEILDTAVADGTAASGRVTSNEYSVAVDVLGPQPGWTAILVNTDNTIALTP